MWSPVQIVSLLRRLVEAGLSATFYDQEETTK